MYNGGREENVLSRNVGKNNLCVILPQWVGVNPEISQRTLNKCHVKNNHCHNIFCTKCNYMQKRTQSVYFNYKKTWLHFCIHLPCHLILNNTIWYNLHNVIKLLVPN